MRILLALAITAGAFLTGGCGKASKEPALHVQNDANHGRLTAVSAQAIHVTVE